MAQCSLNPNSQINLMFLLPFDAKANEKTLFCTINWIRLDEKDLMIDNIVQKKSFPTVRMLHSISSASNNHISSKEQVVS